MSSNSSGKRLEGFFTGKGFYIVLFLCAAVIGVSAWMMAAGNETMDDLSKTNDISLESKRVETIVVPPQTSKEPEASQTDTEEAPTQQDAAALPEQQEDAADTMTEDLTQVWHEGDVMEVMAPAYIWPVQGELERKHQMDSLAYDVTMRDWRTHEGIDISAALGTTVTAAHSGTVSAIETDDLYGTVVTVDHGDGSSSVYANLADTPAVSVGQWVDGGSVIGSVGTTALCEIGQGTHLHFAIYVDGQSVDPLTYLPA